MVPYAVLYSYFLAVSMNQFCIQACSKISVDQNPRVLGVGKETDIRFTCTVDTDCTNVTSYVEKNGKILAYITPNTPNNGNGIDISGTPLLFTATISKTINGDHLGVYNCRANVSFNNKYISFYGCGTNIYSVSGGSSFGTKTGLVVALLWACVGMVYKEL